MTKFLLVGAALVVSAIQLTPVSAQVSEPAAAAARDPNFSIYSSGPAGYGVSRAMAQTLPEDAWEPRTPVRPHRVHHPMKRY
jgi:hypothetical protein